MRGESAQPCADCGVLLGAHLFKQHAHTENSKPAAGMQIEHLAVHFACARAVADADIQFRTRGNRLERIDIATARAQFFELSANARSVAKSNFGIREKRVTKTGAPYRVARLSHGMSLVSCLAICVNILYGPQRAISSDLRSRAPKEVTRTRDRRK
jgi:hypothetical protein